MKFFAASPDLGAKEKKKERPLWYVVLQLMWYNLLTENPVLMSHVS